MLEPEFKFNESVLFAVNCSTQEEIDYDWRELTADGGEPGHCGWLKDNFDLSWQTTLTLLVVLIAGRDRAKATRVMQQMLKIRKIDIKKINEAAAVRD